MTDPHPRLSAEDDERPSAEEAAQVIREDPALNSFSSDDPADADAVTDDDARTNDTAPVGDVRDS
jgi:hypothetical protein